MLNLNFKYTRDVAVTVNYIACRPKSYACAPKTTNLHVVSTTNVTIDDVRCCHE